MKNKFAFTFLIIMIVLVLVGCYGNIDDNKEKKNNVISNTTQNSDGKNTVFEQLPIDMEIIDMDFSLLKKKVNHTMAQVHTDNIRHMGVTLKENQVLYCIFGNVSEYVIVENGLIVGYLSYDGRVMRDMTMKQYFPSDDCYSIAPLIVYGQDSYAYCCWQTEDAYIILGAVKANGVEDNYYNWPTTKHIVLKDFSQFDLSSQIVE